MAVINGWTLYEHPLFVDQRAKLIAAVEAAKKKDSEGYQSTSDAKLLAAILKLTTEIIPREPNDPKFRQGGTLGKARKHWFRAKFGNGRYRLFFQFNSSAKIIIYAWVNDEETLRTYGSKTDAYAMFKSMLDAGNPPENWSDLLNAVQQPSATESKTAKRKPPKKRR